MRVSRRTEYVLGLAVPARCPRRAAGAGQVLRPGGSVRGLHGRGADVRGDVHRGCVHRHRGGGNTGGSRRHVCVRLRLGLLRRRPDRDRCDRRIGRRGDRQPDEGGRCSSARSRGVTRYFRAVRRSRCCGAGHRRAHGAADPTRGRGRSRRRRPGRGRASSPCSTATRWQRSTTSTDATSATSSCSRSPGAPAGRCPRRTPSPAGTAARSSSSSTAEPAAVAPTLELITDKVNKNPIRCDAGLVPTTVSSGCCRLGGRRGLRGSGEPRPSGPLLCEGAGSWASRARRLRPVSHASEAGPCDDPHDPSRGCSGDRLRRLEPAWPGAVRICRGDQRPPGRGGGGGGHHS